MCKTSAAENISDGLKPLQNTQPQLSPKFPKKISATFFKFRQI